MKATARTRRSICRETARPLPWGTLGAVLLSGVASAGCAAQSNARARGPEPALNADAPRQPEAPGPSDTLGAQPAWTLDDEQAGVVTDGVAITQARAESSDGVQRLHIDFDGKGPPPHAKLEKAAAPNHLWLTLSGVRGIPADGLPLLSGEGGPTKNEPAKTGSSPLVSYGRVFLGDDSAIRIELRLDAQRPHRLVTSETPRRLTVEFQR